MNLKSNTGIPSVWANITNETHSQRKKRLYTNNHQSTHMNPADIALLRTVIHAPPKPDRTLFLDSVGRVVNDEDSRVIPLESRRLELESSEESEDPDDLEPTE